MRLENPLPTFMVNLRTRERDLYNPDTLTHEQARDYIPQIDQAQQLYGCYQELGDSPTEALFKVLEACCRQGS